MRRFFSPPEDLVEGAITLAPDETRHLRDVLRLRVGDEVRVFDGEGNEFEARIRSVSERSASLTLGRAVEPRSPESTLDLRLAAAMLKSDKFDLVVQKAVELGVTRLIPLQTLRSEARPRDPRKKTERWRRIALEAAKQCGRAKVMQIDEPTEFKQLAADGDVWFFTERSGSGLSKDTRPKKLTAIVGPEGGWDDLEIDLARSRGFRLVTLGGRILRAETAAITITSILQHRFGDLN